MARDKKHRIATGGGSESWTTPFASLNVQGRESHGNDAPAAARSTATSKNERLLMRRETAHRGGKTVLVLEGFSAAWPASRLDALLHDLKTALGCGGKRHDSRLEIQGELADRLQPLLEARGFLVKRGW